MKDALKEAINDWRIYREGSKDIEQLEKDKEDIISRIIEIIKLPKIPRT